MPRSHRSQLDPSRLAATVRPHRSPAPAAPCIRLSFPARALWELVWKHHPEARRIQNGIRRQSLLLAYFIEANRCGCRAQAARAVGLRNTSGYILSYRFAAGGFEGLLKPRRRRRKNGPVPQVDLVVDLCTGLAKTPRGGLGLALSLRPRTLQMARTARKASTSRRKHQAAIQTLPGQKSLPRSHNHALPPNHEAAPTILRRTGIPGLEVGADLSPAGALVPAADGPGETPAPAPETGALHTPESKERPAHG